MVSSFFFTKMLTDRFNKTYSCLVKILDILERNDYMNTTQFLIQQNNNQLQLQNATNQLLASQSKNADKVPNWMNWLSSGLLTVLVIVCVILAILIIKTLIEDARD